ncbi:MAG: VOC family protein, partial [Thermoanaerobaculia bacterium]
LAPSGFRLPEATRLGPVRLQVAELERSVAFYRDVLGLELLEHVASRAMLGTAPPEGRVLVELHERRGARPAPGRGRIGLFHFAILLPHRPALGRFVRHLGELDIRAGAADHLVSEALYLQDPDNLGIEVYRDRPRDEWRRAGRELLMATDPLDREALLEAAGDEPWQGVPAGTVMGHVHLHVAELDAAAAFYCEGLGFDRTVWGYSGALFLGAGGYHHHLGTNLWAGRGATRPPADEAQLLEWTLELPGERDQAAVAASLERGGYESEASAGAATSFAVRDPSGTRVRIARGSAG